MEENKIVEKACKEFDEMYAEAFAFIEEKVIKSFEEEVTREMCRTLLGMTEAEFDAAQDKTPVWRRLAAECHRLCWGAQLIWKEESHFDEAYESLEKMCAMGRAQAVVETAYGVFCRLMICVTGVLEIYGAMKFGELRKKVGWCLLAAQCNEWDGRGLETDDESIAIYNEFVGEILDGGGIEKLVGIIFSKVTETSGDEVRHVRYAEPEAYGLLTAAQTGVPKWEPANCHELWKYLDNGAENTAEYKKLADSFVQCGVDQGEAEGFVEDCLYTLAGPSEDAARDALHKAQEILDDLELPVEDERRALVAANFLALAGVVRVPLRNGNFAVTPDEARELLEYCEFDTAPDIYRNVGRNDPCPCGSGKKYKKCCGRK